MVFDTDLVWSQIVDKVARTRQRIACTFPHISQYGQYDTASPSWWTGGFWPGILWLTFEETGDHGYRELAQQCSVIMNSLIGKRSELNHDVGFMWMLSSVAEYGITGNVASKRYGMHASNLLAGRFNVAGNFIRAWDHNAAGSTCGWAIIDSVMNLSLLYWATATTGDPRFQLVAQAHTETVLREFLRPDGSCYHIVEFDPATGDRIRALAGQGRSPDSAWARGVAWALYGLAVGYAYTQETRYLDAAKRVAHFFLAALPRDGVPYWDFRLPSLDAMPRDSSAGAIAASGLLELARLVSQEERALYDQGALHILKGLNETCATWNDTDEEGILGHGTSNYPQGVGVDRPLIYGDYFFIEALAKLKGRPGLFYRT